MLLFRQVYKGASIVFDFLAPLRFFCQRIFCGGLTSDLYGLIKQRLVLVAQAVIEVQVDNPLLGLLKVVRLCDIFLLLI